MSAAEAFDAGTRRLLGYLQQVIHTPMLGLQGDRAFSWSSRRGRLRTINFQLADGSILLHLPALLTEGRVSGLIQLVPRSNDLGAAREQTARLASYYINGGDAIVPVGAGLFETRFSVGAHAVSLSNAAGRELARAPLPVLPQTTATIALPSIGQASEPIALIGPWFDGRISLTRIVIDGHETLPLAVSEQEAIVTLPDGCVGPVALSVRGGRGALDIVLNAVRLHATLTETEIVPDGSSWLELRVEGTDSAETILVANHAPSVVGLTRGDQQATTVSRGEVWRERIVGLRPGNFAVSVLLADKSSGSDAAAALAKATIVAGRVRASYDI